MQCVRELAGCNISSHAMSRLAMHAAQLEGAVRSEQGARLAEAEARCTALQAEVAAGLVALEDARGAKSRLNMQAERLSAQVDSLQHRSRSLQAELVRGFHAVHGMSTVAAMLQPCIAGSIAIDHIIIA